jgi:hypothetical protein
MILLLIHNKLHINKTIEKKITTITKRSNLFFINMYIRANK